MCWLLCVLVCMQEHDGVDMHNVLHTHILRQTRTHTISDTHLCIVNLPLSGGVCGEIIALGVLYVQVCSWLCERHRKVDIIPFIVIVC